MKLCLQILTCGLMLGYLVSADRTASCQRVPVNNDRVQGECCVFVKERPKDLREELLGLLDSKLPSHMFLQNKAHFAEDAKKTIIGSMSLHNEEVQHIIDKQPILIIEHNRKNHEGPSRDEEGHHHHHEHIHSQENSKKSNSAPLKSFKGIEEQMRATESNDGGEMISVTTETGSTAVHNTTGNITVGKTVLDNRNAIDVPIVECPAGQARDPSGRCVSEFI